ncbi:MAG: Hpt domain-containing protein [Calditrichaeota bacterium]|nr:MAG: Hpt domain-containing protein [Calditrichota bacterium]
MSEQIVVYVDEDLEDLVPGFLENRNEDIDSIKQLIQDGNFPDVQRIGHSMKGSGGGYGFDKISEIGKGIEEFAKSESKDEILKLVNDLAHYLSVIKIEFIESEW